MFMRYIKVLYRARHKQRFIYICCGLTKTERFTVRQTFLEAELVLPASLEVVEGYEELRVVLLLGQQVLLGGPACGRLQGQRRGSGGGRLALRQVRDVRQRPALQQRLCNTPRHRQSSLLRESGFLPPAQLSVRQYSFCRSSKRISSIQAEDIRKS